MVEPKVRHEAQPQLRDVGVGIGRHQPAVDGGNNVGILMRQEDVFQIAAAQHRERRRQHLAVDLVAAGIKQHAGAAMGDDVLVRLNGEAAQPEIFQENVLVCPVVEKNSIRHCRYAPGQPSGCGFGIRVVVARRAVIRISLSRKTPGWLCRSYAAQ
jgi:hypothetical protein